MDSVEHGEYFKIAPSIWYNPVVSHTGVTKPESDDSLSVIIGIM